MGMTVIEKILARNSGLGRVWPGDIVTTKVETAILFDNNFMETSWREILAVHDPAKVVVVFDHRAPASHVLNAKAHQTGRAFVKRFGINAFMTSVSIKVFPTPWWRTTAMACRALYCCAATRTPAARACSIWPPAASAHRT